MPAGDRYVEVNSEAFEALLTSLGFSSHVANSELVYTKRPYSECPELMLKVYTSIAVGDSAARGCGEDAIRVVAVWDNGATDGKKISFGVCKNARVYRTGSQEGVFERVQDRIAQADTRCKEWMAGNSHVGKVGDDVRLTLTVVARKVWKDRFMFTMADKEGHTFVYWTDKDVLQANETYDIGARIRGHNSYNGRKQTELTNCKGKRVVQ